MRACGGLRCGLYGKSKKPSAKQLEGLEVVVFDMQDVGVRCYTYASTMHYVMESMRGAWSFR